MTERSLPTCKQADLCLTLASMEPLKFPVLVTGWPGPNTLCIHVEIGAVGSEEFSF